ncbi:MAG: hemerythrin domain-containing protein [Ignavibacteria bacterium]|jgi:hemerythrin-like domain-containing protein|nr:hemerythrin domain-containing protein [Ignavibacteria bacterium]MCU7504901.1 hemerythrin domain-containing protein [Ignavibacteria bacterium]MCU7517807.1 hemerythrin domain-containing protein [Ignavibacteria bacterium]
MDAFELLIRDHREIMEVFREVEISSRKKDGKLDENFNRLLRNLELHMNIEETMFYPNLVSKKETADITLEGIEEHHVIREILKELNLDPGNTAEWRAKLKVCRENLEHHINEEETEMFPDVPKVLSKERLSQIANQLEEKKRELLELNIISCSSGKKQRRQRLPE